MQILVCAATVAEIKPTIDHLAGNDLAGKVDVLITGVGMTATTYNLTKALGHKKPSLIIQAGIGGSLDPNDQLSQTVIVYRDFIGDLGVEENKIFRSVFDMGLVDKDQQPFMDGWLINPHHDILKESDLPMVSGVTVNEISTHHNRISYYKKTGAAVESMEGAALHFVALKENIPFLQLRSLSNFIGERDKSKWEMENSIKALNNQLQHLIIKMAKR